MRKRLDKPRLFTRRHVRGVQRNVGAYTDEYSASIIEICRTIRSQHSLHSASFAVMPRRRFIGPEILDKVVALKIRYHPLILLVGRSRGNLVVGIGRRGGSLILGGMLTGFAPLFQSAAGWRLLSVGPYSFSHGSPPVWIMEFVTRRPT
jgi:hypothetical protein